MEGVGEVLGGTGVTRRLFRTVRTREGEMGGLVANDSAQFVDPGPVAKIQTTFGMSVVWAPLKPHRSPMAGGGTTESTNAMDASGMESFTHASLIAARAVSTYTDTGWAIRTWSDWTCMPRAFALDRFID